MVQVKIELNGTTHRVIKAKAALKGMVMKDYLVAVLDRDAAELMAELMEVQRRESDGQEEREEGQKK